MITLYDGDQNYAHFTDRKTKPQDVSWATFLQDVSLSPLDLYEMTFLFCWDPEPAWIHQSQYLLLTLK